MLNDEAATMQCPVPAPVVDPGADRRMIDGMATYVISEVEVLDETQGQRYREPAAASVKRHGGRYIVYIVRGAQPEVPEGSWPNEQRVVVVEFPSMDQLRGWYGSDDYAEALAVRETALSRRLLFVEGVHPSG